MLKSGDSRIVTARTDETIVNDRQLHPIPKIALLPLIILWMGIGEMPKVAIIALGVFFPVVINTFSGVKNVDPMLIKAAVTFGSNHLNVIRRDGSGTDPIPAGTDV